MSPLVLNVGKQNVTFDFGYKHFNGKAQTVKAKVVVYNLQLPKKIDAATKKLPYVKLFRDGIEEMVTRQRAAESAAAAAAGPKAKGSAKAKAKAKALAAALLAAAGGEGAAALPRWKKHQHLFK